MRCVKPFQPKRVTATGNNRSPIVLQLSGEFQVDGWPVKMTTPSEANMVLENQLDG